MIQLPRCPHCGMHFRYRQVSSGRMVGQKDCPHCHRPFRASFGPTTGLMALIIFLAAITVNALMLRVMNANGWVVLFISLVNSLAFYFLLPLTVRYKDEKGQTFSASERSLLVRTPKEKDKAATQNPRKMSRSVRVRRKKEERRREKENRS